MSEKEIISKYHEEVVIFKFVIEKYMTISKLPGKNECTEVGTNARNKCMDYGINKGISPHTCEIIFNNSIDLARRNIGILDPHIILKKIREEANKNQKDMAKMMEIPIDKYISFEEGRGDLKDKLVLDVHKKLHNQKAFKEGSIFN